MEHIKKVALSVLAAMAAVCMAVALLFLTLPTQRVSAATVTAGDADALQAAINDAGEGDVIQLAANITGNITVPEGKDIALDLNGFTLTNESDHTIMNYGVLTIVDDSMAGTGTVDNVTHARGALFNFGEATLLGGTYTRSLENGSSATESGGNSWYVIKNLGHLTIGEENAECDVAVKQSGHFSSMITNGYYNADGSGDHLQYSGSVTTEDKIPTLVINGGTFSGGINTVKNDNHSVAVINGGEFTNVSQAVVLNWNDLTITGGEFVAGKGAQAAIITSYDNTGFNDGKTTITGGTFEGAVTADYNPGNVTYSVSGGTFSEGLPADYIAEDAVLYQQVDGSYTVADSETAAEDGVVVVMDGVGYASLEEAVAEGCKVIIEREGEAISEGFANINSSKFVDTAFTAALEAAEEGDVLRLVDDYKGVLSIDTLDRSITVDLNGHNWSASSGTAVVYVTTSADFTLINSGKEGGINANISAINIKAASGADVDVTIVNVNVSSSRIASTLISLTGTDGTMRINLNGLDVEYTVTNENQAMALSVTDADLTMTDSNISIAYGSETPGSATTTAIDLNHANAELTCVTATSEDGAGIVFTGSMSFDEAVAASVSEYAHLTLNGCTVSGSTIALSGNGGKNLSGTLIDVQNSTLTSTGNAGLAIYHPQYGVLNILGKGNTLTGVTGIEIRAGELNVEGGTITATGAFASKPSGGGSTTDGVAIAVTQHTTALPIDVKISDGTLNATGAEGKSLYQANVQGNDPTDVAKIEMQVTGGTFNAAVESENVTGFIHGGQYKVLPAEELFAEGYTGELYNGYYIVVGEGTAAEDVGALLTARLEAQTDVRLYAAALGFRWADVQDDAEIASAYAAINAATSTSAVALAKAQAMDAIDAYCAAYEEELTAAREAALEKIEAAAGDDIAVPTSVYAAINGGASVEEIEAYAEAAVKEIEAIRSLRTEITAQAGELEGIAAAVEKLEGAFAGQGGEFDSLLGDIRAAISAAQEAIESGTSEALQDMQAALEAKIDAGTQAVKDAVAGVMEELTELAESVAAGDKALQEAIAAGEKALAEQIEAVQGDIGALEGAVDGQASDLQASIDALESAVGEQASAVQADIDALRAAIAAAQADIDDILASIAAGGPSFEELAEQIAAIKSTADGLQTSVDDVQTAVKAAQDAVAAAQGALSGQIEEADDAAAFTTLYVLVGIALALSAAAVALLVVLLLKRSKAE